MEKLNNYEINKGERLLIKEKLELTSKVLKRLALWGLITFSPEIATEVRAENVNINNQNIVSEALSYENSLKQEGLLSMEEKRDKPVIAFMSKDDINGIKPNDSDEYKFSEILSEKVSFPFVNGEGFNVVERGEYNLRTIVKEHKLVEEGLIAEGQQTKLGNWISADYYVVSSVEKINDKYVLKNEIIDMEDGNNVFVSVKSDKEYSESSINELAQKTEKAIEKIKLNKQNEQEK